MSLLARLGLLSADDVRLAVAGELGVLATSPHRALDQAHLARLTASDPVARATLMARGALYALRESAQLRARTKGERGLEAVLLDLRKRAEGGGGRTFTVDDWLQAIGRDDPEASRTFEACITRGDTPSLPATALGPCFRPDRGEYVAYDPGFDIDATRMSKDGKVVGLRAGGPAAKAGLAEGDEVVSMQTREGDPDVPVKLDVMRATKKLTLSYAPRGVHGKGQTWTRVPGLRDAQCGQPL
jgi:predicted metalloprotease with PDZ domain